MFKKLMIIVCILAFFNLLTVSNFAQRTKRKKVRKGVTIKIPARTVVKFKAGSELKAAVNLSKPIDHRKNKKGKNIAEKNGIVSPGKRSKSIDHRKNKNTPLLKRQGVTFTKLDESEKHQDISFLSAETGVDRKPKIEHQSDVRDHRRVEKSVSLKVNQRLLLTNGSYIKRLANGTVNIIRMNDRVVKTFPQGKIVKDKSGEISIISGKQRVQAGKFKAKKITNQAMKLPPLRPIKLNEQGNNVKLLRVKKSKKK